MKMPNTFEDLLETVRKFAKLQVNRIIDDALSRCVNDDDHIVLGDIPELVM
jgi:hypothetical protein